MVIPMKREKICFDGGWLFHKGEINREISSGHGIAYISGKTERYHVGPAAKDYFADANSYSFNVEHKTETWERVDLPHDYAVGELPDKKYNCALGFVPYENAWYIKRFTLTDEDRNKRITLLFEGVATHATVYLNGALMKHNFCGYTPFEVDITDNVRFNAENTLSVYVETNEHEGWWYEGGGIYRHVYMIKTDLLSVDLYGIYVRPVPVSDGLWSVNTEVTVRNDGIIGRDVTVRGAVIDADGKSVSVSEGKGYVADKDRGAVCFNVPVMSPCLWSPDSPQLYTFKAEVYSGGELTDEQTVRFGFRTFECDPERGLIINGRPYKIKGVSEHEGCGFFGKAVPDNVQRHKVRIIKEMGANGYRTAHYMHSEAIMDALDEYGFIVLDETRWFESTDEGREQLATLIKRDRNRPGVFFWSLGNEEPYFTTDVGRRIIQSLISLVRKLDRDRPITAACNMPGRENIFDLVDVIGVNYNLDVYGEIRKKYPDKCILGTENCAVEGTRGWYHESDRRSGRISAYDDATEVFAPQSREESWRFMTERPYVLGEYNWSTFEYRGEAAWPNLAAQYGAVDLFMQKKDAYYVNKALFTDAKDETVLHLMPHWSFEGFEGRNIRVCAYTNAPWAELFLNGASLGVKNTEDYRHAEWQVPFTPGELTARAYGSDGKTLATVTHKTAKAPFALKLSLDNADGLKCKAGDAALLSCYVVDESGNDVPNAEPLVHFFAEGAGTVFATGSDIADHGELFKPDRKMRAGRIGVAVRLNGKEDTLRVYAEAEGLRSAVLEYEL